MLCNAISFIKCLIVQNGPNAACFRPGCVWLLSGDSSVCSQYSNLPRSQCSMEMMGRQNTPCQHHASNLRRSYSLPGARQRLLQPKPAPFFCCPAWLGMQCGTAVSAKRCRAARRHCADRWGAACRTEGLLVRLPYPTQPR